MLLGLKSLQDAMRFREKSAEEAEKKVQELRKAGVIAEIEVIGRIKSQYLITKRSNTRTKTTCTRQKRIAEIRKRNFYNEREPSQS